MIIHYFTIAWRSLRKNPVYSIINLLGLTVGLSCGILILSYVLFEQSYDSYHPNKERIYQLISEYDFPEESGFVGMTPSIASPLYQREFPEIEAGVRILYSGGFSPSLVKFEEKRFQEQRFFYADSSFFEVFSYKLLQGNPQKALTNPLSVVITASIAKKYFGDEAAVGKFLQIGSRERNYQVTGVMEDMPENTHFHCDFIASFSTLGASRREIWGSANYQTYFLLTENADPQALLRKMNSLLDEKMAPNLQEGQDINALLVPIEEVHLRPDITAQTEEAADPTYILLFLGIAMLILLIACINYMNLATARSMERAKEVALKKVFGAVRRQLSLQFLIEAVLITVVAMALALFLAAALLPTFSELTERQLDTSYWFHPQVILILLSIVLTVSILAGAYPAWIFTTFRPALVLKGAFKRSKGGNLLRKSLVVFQFAISIFLIIATLVVQKQLGFMQNIKLGYDREQVLELPHDDKIQQEQAQFKNALSQIPEFKSITFGSESPVGVGGTYSVWREAAGENTAKLTKAIAVDPFYPKTLGLQLLAGDDFKESMLQDTVYAFILNENAIEALGYEDQQLAIGDPINLNGRAGRIIGICNNFYTQSLRQEMESLVLFLEPGQFNHMFVKLNTQNMQATLKQVEKSWNEAFPHRPFEYSFLDESYNKLYKTEVRIGQIFGIFASLAIFIAALGLLGLSSYTILQRSKEISIRKVLGASVNQIANMLSGSFLKLVAIAFVIATPLAYFVMESWLDGFAYKVTIGLSTILIAAGVALLIGLMTVGYQSLRAGFMNPVDWLKND